MARLAGVDIPNEKRILPPRRAPHSPVAGAATFPPSADGESPPLRFSEKRRSLV